MMPREVARIPMRSMTTPFAALLLAACTCVPFGPFGAAAARKPVRKIPKFEIKLSGPASLEAQYSLESQRFTARLTNRSAEPQVLFVRGEYLMNARWDWTVTDAKGQYVGMDFVLRGYCGTPAYSEEGLQEARHINDKDLIMVAPGESREFPIPAGPSDDYSFPKAGTYQLAVTLTYVPPNATYYFDERGRKQKARGYEQWDLSRLSLDGLQAVQNSLSVQATSDVWNLTLSSPRTNPDARGTFTVLPVQR